MGGEYCQKLGFPEIADAELIISEIGEPVLKKTPVNYLVILDVPLLGMLGQDMDNNVLSSLGMVQMSLTFSNRMNYAKWLKLLVMLLAFIVFHGYKKKLEHRVEVEKDRHND